MIFSVLLRWFSCFFYNTRFRPVLLRQVPHYG